MKRPAVVDALLYRGAIGRWIFRPIASLGYRRYCATGRTPRWAYTAMRKLFGQADVGLWERFERQVVESRPRGGPTVGDGVAAGEVDHAVRALERDGLVVLDARLPADVCAELTELAMSSDCALADLPDRPRARYRPEDPRAIRYSLEEVDILTSGAAQRLVADASLLQIAHRYLGATPIQDLVTMWWSTSLGGDHSRAAQQFHFDLDRVRFLKVFILLTDVGDDNGPHVYVRGSHRDLPPAFRRDGRYPDAAVFERFGERVMKIGGPRGTIFLADTRGLHKGQVLNAGHRLIFQLEYAVSLFGAPYARPEVAQPTDELRQMASAHPMTFQRFRVSP
jgi:hypothetical protein